MKTIVERVREAHASGTPLRIRGAGTWLGAGRPVNATDTLSVADDRGITEYVPGDLTLTARAGTPLADIATATRANGQWLPLDPWGGDGGTIGATVSTATAGPHAYALGLPRDMVLGMEFVSGTGEVINAGGRVVKNVAGFDLARLIVGAWGTLGVITEVTVRLRARPDRTQTLGIAISPTPLALNELALRVRALPFAPLASELINERLAAHLGLGSAPMLICRVGGNERSVAGQVDLLRSIGRTTDLEENIVDRLRVAEVGSSGAGTWRWSNLPSLFGATWSAAAEACRDLEAFMHGSPARGVVRVVARGEASQLARAASAYDGTRILECLPSSAWPLVQAETPNSVSRAIREKFNPRAILNAGILGAGT